jgi:hypothetical protein
MQRRPSLPAHVPAVDDARVDEWVNARSGGTIIGCCWSVTLTAAFLGLLVTRTFFEAEPLPSLTAQLPMTFGGSFCMALACTAGTLSRRRRERANAE